MNINISGNGRFDPRAADPYEPVCYATLHYPRRPCTTSCTNPSFVTTVGDSTNG
jgi:hypothetical protein